MASAAPTLRTVTRTSTLSSFPGRSGKTSRPSKAIVRLGKAPGVVRVSTSRAESLAESGSMLGSGAIIVVDSSQSVVEVCLKLARFYAHESCGKCTPCREGTSWTVKMLERVKDGSATPMDLDIMASVQERIIGNCLCVLGDAMAMPVGSMIAKFRGEFEDHIETARAASDRAALAGAL